MSGRGAREKKLDIPGPQAGRKPAAGKNIFNMKIPNVLVPVLVC